MTESVIFSIYQPMVSALGELAKHKYHFYVGKRGRKWAVAATPAAADFIYAEGGPGSEGMGGRMVEFEAADGGEKVRLIGPWRTTADELLADTGVDVRDKYSQQGIVSLEIEHGRLGSGDRYTRILHHDEMPTIGSFDRIAIMAQDYADDFGVPVHMAVRRRGGSQASTKFPTKKGN